MQSNPIKKTTNAIKATMKLGATDRCFASGASSLKAIQIPSRSLHFIFFRLQSDEIRGLVKLSAKLKIPLELTPLLLNKMQLSKFSLTEDEYAAQLEKDLELLSDFLQVPSSIQDIIRDVRSTSLHSKDCEINRLYVSSSGKIRRCPYERHSEVDVFLPRSELFRKVNLFSALEIKKKNSCCGICYAA